MAWKTAAAKGVNLAEKKGYKGFGSFMSESLEVLIEKAAEGRNAPEVPFETSWKGEVFGGKEDFNLDLEKFTFVNHGAFGGALKVGSVRSNEWRQYSETQPLRFFDRALFPHLVESSRRLAGFLGASPRNLALVQNATSALDAVISSVARKSAAENNGTPQKMVYFDTAYGSVKRMIRKHSNNNGHELVVPFPLRSEEDLLGLVEAYLSEHGAETCLGVIDHMTSNTALVLPIEKLTKLFREHSVPVLVDGAHGPNALPIDLGSGISSEFYVGNCHKWLCSPKSVGFLHVGKESWHNYMHPRINSHGANESFPQAFFWDGCRDYAAALALPVVLDFWESYGVEKVRMENKQRVKDAASMLSKSWGTSQDFLANLESEFMCGPMCLVPLPPTISFTNASDAAFQLQEKLYQDFHIECPVKNIRGRLYLRISHHIYNSSSDFEKVDMAIRELCESSSGSVLTLKSIS